MILPFPVRPGVFGYLHLPDRPLTHDEAERLSEFVMSLVEGEGQDG